MWKLLAAAVLVAIAVAIVVEHAVTNTQIRTIADVRSSNTIGGTVALQGTITFASDNRFILDDGTGKAELATCPLWYKRVGFHKGDYITVVGQVMSNPSLSLKCDFVISVYKAFRGNEVIEVRRQPGKPPWIESSSAAIPSARNY